MIESVDTPLISATEPDWSREEFSRWWEPSRQLLKSIRMYQKWQKYDGLVGRFFRGWNVLQYRFWTVVTASDIP